MNAPARLSLAVTVMLSMAVMAPPVAWADGLSASEGLDATPVSAPGGSVEYRSSGGSDLDV
jgi:hypothetical protein